MRNNQKSGMFYAFFAYFLWGLFPLYWKPIEQVPAIEILAHRIFWSFIFMIVLLFFLRKMADLKSSIMDGIYHPRTPLLLLLASVLVSANWFIYIWAVNHGHVIETSMGYYINPLVSILLGIIFLREKLNRWQLIAFLLAACGVGIQTFSYGHIPWIAIGLALTFGFYGLVKKKVDIDAFLGLTYETFFVMPVALIYLTIIQVKGAASFATVSPMTTALLIGTGIVTAVPLICFAQGARRISLTMIGFFQYLTPTMTLILGIALFKEPFTHVQLLSFSFVWLALIVFSISGIIPKKKFHLEEIA
ncbi:transporter [Weizmannia acidilactici]|uniref:Transporter n=1 Tax=Weizmannia acidilactici TaxID=2607726 RepID=A0A5J4JGT8_9BACI|nr:EamA family transporter RarD [Weizmannia acidilactici]GER70931.1 transporter [Weizmannia acidilactici]GER73954.1 transporter [Weizmannia acidilactici]